MAISTQDGKTDITMDPDKMYREELFTDRTSGSIRMLTPVDRAGKIDEAGTVVFVGEAQLMTPMGAMPLAFQIDASSLGEAAEKFGDEAKIAVEKAAKELQELRREAASSIVVPQGAQQGPAGLGGGKIKIP